MVYLATTVASQTADFLEEISSWTSFILLCGAAAMIDNDGLETNLALQLDARF
jgi:hypothetical protein